MLVLAVSLILFLPGCGLLTGGEGDPTEAPGNTDGNYPNESERPGVTDEPGPTEDSNGGKSHDPNDGPGTGNKDIDALLQRASSHTNYYSEFTYYKDLKTETWKVWYRKPLMHAYWVERGGGILMDYDDMTEIQYLGDKGMKFTLYELNVDKFHGFTLVNLPLCLKGVNEGSVQLVTTRDETMKGRACRLYEFETIGNALYRFYFDKENGFVLYFEEIYMGKTTWYFDRTVLEFDIVTDDDLKLPEGIEIDD